MVALVVAEECGWGQDCADSGCEMDPDVWTVNEGILDDTNRQSNYVCPTGAQSVCEFQEQNQHACRGVCGDIEKGVWCRVVQPIDGPWSSTGKYRVGVHIHWSGPWLETAGQYLQTYRIKVTYDGNTLYDQAGGHGVEWDMAFYAPYNDDFTSVPTYNRVMRWEVWLYKKNQVGFYQTQEIRDAWFSIVEDPFGYYPGGWGGSPFQGDPGYSNGPQGPDWGTQPETEEDWNTWWDWLRSLFTPSEAAQEDFFDAVNSWKAAGFVGMINQVAAAFQNPSGNGDDEDLLRLGTYEFEGIEVPSGLADDFVVSGQGVTLVGWMTGGKGLFSGDLTTPSTFVQWLAVLRRWCGWVVYLAWGLCMIAWLKGKLVSTV